MRFGFLPEGEDRVQYLIALPGVIVDDLIIRSNEGVINDLQTRVDQRHSGQLQTMNGITL